MAISSSGIYTFQSIRAEIIIREAYEYIGIIGDLLVAQQLDSALRSINFLLTDWSNRNINLWTLRNSFISLQPGVTTYVLPIETSKVIQAELRTSNNQSNLLNGDAFSSAGDADNAFDLDPNTSCDLEDNVGFIGFDFGADVTQTSVGPQIINFVGITFAFDITVPITCSIDASIDGVGGNWVTLLDISIPNFTANVNQWFNVDNIIPYRAYRILFNAPDGIDINISRIFFNNNITDNVMTEVSRYEYLQYSQKNTLGRPSVYYVDYLINPTITVWQNPSPEYNCMYYSAQNMAQSLTGYTQSIDIPSTFYEPMVLGLACKLALKYAPDKLQLLQQQYERAMQMAIIKDNSDIPINIGVYGQ